MSRFISIDDDPLGSLAATPAAHFRLWYLAAVTHIVERLARNLGSLDDVLEQFAFLRDYLGELAALGGPEDWFARVRRWESSAQDHLPLRALREVLALDEETVTLLFAAGLIEEDPRFGFVIECAQPLAPGQHRPTQGLLSAWWRSDDDGLRGRIRLLLRAGLLQVLNPDAPRLQWVFECPPAVWDALRGELQTAAAPWLHYRAAGELPRLEDLVLGAATREAAERGAALLRSGAARTLIVRGPRHNGRRTVAAAIAASLGRGVIDIDGGTGLTAERASLAGTLATLAHAMPVVRLDLVPGQTAELPPLAGSDGPTAVVAGAHGGIVGDGVNGAITIPIGMPAAEQRARLWQLALPDHSAADAAELGRRFRMTSGNVHAAAAHARAQAMLRGSSRVEPVDVRSASRSRHRDLETLATLLPSFPGWENLSASFETLDELRGLESRCRHREALQQHTGPALSRQLNCGVRALFAGPSGTGKTMAARILAAELQLDLYRLDLSSVVNKYLGETEKNLHHLFSAAEELDVVLLIDEGDALLTSRTAVASSNDRYANLETNFLLQRLESFEGIVIVTTNAASRIDPAFQRRMDVVVDFRRPDARERRAIWDLHLPPTHAVAEPWLAHAAARCDLSGGQIRNAVLYASVIACNEQRPLAAADLTAAVRREYRKSGDVCPLRE